MPPIKNISRDDWVTVRTTLPTVPLPPSEQRAPSLTERLVVRTLTMDDLAAAHELRTQPEVMVHTSRGLIDDDLDMTLERLERFVPPKDAETFHMAICLRGEDGAEGPFIGMGGVHVFSGQLGWPEVGYMLKKEYWGKGYATDFLRAYVQMWSALPRPAEPAPALVSPATLAPEVVQQARAAQADGSPAPVVDEKLAAVVADYNKASQNVVGKGGFVELLTIDEEDTHTPGTRILLHYFQYLPGQAGAVVG